MNNILTHETLQLCKELQTIANRYEENPEEIITLQTSYRIRGAFQLNLMFSSDKKLFIEEHLRKRKFNRYSPLTLNIEEYHIKEKAYGKDQLHITFTISLEEYLEYLLFHIQEKTFKEKEEEE